MVFTYNKVPVPEDNLDRVADQMQSKHAYTQVEAATILGISVDELRRLICRYIISDAAELPLDFTSHASDVLVLKLLLETAPLQSEDVPSIAKERGGSAM